MQSGATTRWYFQKQQYFCAALIYLCYCVFNSKDMEMDIGRILGKSHIQKICNVFVMVKVIINLCQISLDSHLNTTKLFYAKSNLSQKWLLISLHMYFHQQEEEDENNSYLYNLYLHVLIWIQIQPPDPCFCQSLYFTHRQILCFCFSVLCTLSASFCFSQT